MPLEKSRIPGSNWTLLFDAQVSGAQRFSYPDGSISKSLEDWTNRQERLIPATAPDAHSRPLSNSRKFWDPWDDVVVTREERVLRISQFIC
jgi:hypothetical protein